MTTLNGAKFVHRESTMGSVAAGKQAELVLLDANPLDGVQNFHRIAGVVRAGHYYSKAALEGPTSGRQAGVGSAGQPAPYSGP